MRRRSILVLTFTLLSVPASLAQTINVTTADGGSVVTELGYGTGIKVNKNSSLRRSFVTFNDPACPVQLNSSGVTTQYDGLNRSYYYRPLGTLTSNEPVSAIDVRFLLYDVFGDHIRTLGATYVGDIATNDAFQLGDIGSWRAWENEVRELYTIVSFVARVRTQSGKIWRYNEKVIGEELNKVRLKVSSGVLEPSKEK
ncbi:MAG: hypothetical protein KatS3mg077_1327 [Candidatus Binatia bacterium]|nr:MAG: hypothetical protein KatS3mg077_1327 [Candidatus Binatia bacterium]